MTPELVSHFHSIGLGQADPISGVGVLADHAEELGHPLAPIYRAMWDQRNETTKYGLHLDNDPTLSLHHGGHTAEWFNPPSQHDRRTNPSSIVYHNFTPTRDGNVVVSLGGTTYRSLDEGGGYQSWNMSGAKVPRRVAEVALMFLQNDPNVSIHWAQGEDATEPGRRLKTSNPIADLRNSIQAATGHPVNLGQLPPEPPVQLSRRVSTADPRADALRDPTVLARYSKRAQSAMAGVVAERERVREERRGAPRRYGATEGDVNNLLGQIASNPEHRVAGSNLRGVAADALQEQGRDREAQVLRSHPHTVRIHNGRVYREYRLPQRRRDTALEWHGGGGTGLYEVGSSGVVNGESARRALGEMDDVRTEPTHVTALDLPQNRHSFDRLYDHLAEIERATADEGHDEPEHLSRREGAQVRVKYGRAPADEVVGIARQQAKHGGAYDPNNHSDHVLADKLGDYGDPLETVVRRDLSYRVAGDSGSQQFIRNVQRHINDLGQAGSELEEETSIQRRYHEIGGHGRLETIPYGNDGNNNALAYEMRWLAPRGSVYYAAMSPEETIHLLNEHGIQHNLQLPWQGKKSEQMSRRRYATKKTRETGELLREVAFRLVEELDLSPDYQRLFWNPKTKVAWYVTADGDEESEVKKVRNALENVPGVDHVRIEAEYFPPDDDSGWVEMFDRNDRDEGWKPWPPKERKSRRRYAAYRAPAGGMVVRGTQYKGGEMVPDMGGKFANPTRKQGETAPSPPQPTVSYGGEPASEKPGDVRTGRRRRRRRKVQNRVSPENPT